MNWTVGTKFIQNFRKPEGKKQFRKLLCRWEDNIKIDLILILNIHLNIISIKTNIIFIVIIINISILHDCCCYFGKLNISKTRVIAFTRKSKVPYYTYKIWDSYIACMDTIKDLGVQLDSKLYFHAHADYIISHLSWCWA
jgi:hypothetical protein